MKRLLLLIFAATFLLSCSKSQTLKVLQFNIWQEGTVVAGGYEGVVQQIIYSKADIVTLSEVRNYKNTRFCDRIVKSLADKGHTFYSFYSYDTGILSRYPIKDSTTVFPENNDHGSIYKAVVDVNGREVAVYTAHLDYLNCAYYMVKGYDGNTWNKYDKPVTNIDTILQVNIASQRDDAIRDFINEAVKDREKGRIVIIGGDFNEPSHLDWTDETKNMFDRQGLVIPWTVTTMLDKAGFIDAYRYKYPNPVTHPGITYPSYCEGAEIKKLTWAPDADERERIDYIFYTPAKGLTLDDVIIWGPQSSISYSRQVNENTQDKFGIGNSIWPTDHKAVLATFIIE